MSNSKKPSDISDSDSSKLNEDNVIESIRRRIAQDLQIDYNEMNRKLRDLGISMREAFCFLAITVYRGGLHDNIRDDTVIRSQTEERNAIYWSDLKSLYNYNRNRRVILIRYICEFERQLAVARPLESILVTHANKYNLQTELSQIDPQWRFFGANIHPGIDAVNSWNYIQFISAVANAARLRSAG